MKPISPRPLREMINFGAWQSLPSFTPIRHTLSAAGNTNSLTDKFLDASGIDPDELRTGIRAEWEACGADANLCKKIAIRNIKSDPHYYSSLKKYGVETEMNEDTVEEQLLSIDDIQINPMDIFAGIDAEKARGLSLRQAGLEALGRISNEPGCYNGYIPADKDRGVNVSGQPVIYGNYAPIENPEGNTLPYQDTEILGGDKDQQKVPALSIALNELSKKYPVAMIQMWKFFQTADDNTISNMNTMIQKGQYPDAWKLITGTIEEADPKVNGDHQLIHKDADKMTKEVDKPKNYPDSQTKDNLMKTLAENTNTPSGYGGWMDKNGNITNVPKIGGHDDVAMQIIRSFGDGPGLTVNKPTRYLLSRGYVHMVNDSSEPEIALVSRHPLNNEQTRSAKNLGMELKKAVNNFDMVTGKVTDVYDPSHQLEENAITGTASSSTASSSINPAELAMGITVEMEHTDDEKVASEIANDHLKKDPHYYTKLQKAGLADECGPVASSGIGDPSNPINKDFRIGEDATPTAGNNTIGEIGHTPTLNTIGKSKYIDSKNNDSFKGRRQPFQPNSNITALKEAAVIRDIPLKLKRAMEMLKPSGVRTRGSFHVTEDMTKKDPKMTGAWTINAFNHKKLPPMKNISPRPRRLPTMNEAYLLNTPQYGDVVRKLHAAYDHNKGVTREELDNIALGDIEDVDIAEKFVTEFMDEYGLNDNENPTVKEDSKPLSNTKSRGSFAMTKEMMAPAAKMAGKWTTNSFNESKKLHPLNENYHAIKAVLDEAIMDNDVKKKAQSMCETISQICGHLEEKCKGKSCNENPALSASLTMEDENGGNLDPHNPADTRRHDFMTNESIFEVEGIGKMKVGNIKETLSRRLNTMRELSECGDYKSLTAHTTNGQFSVLEAIKSALKMETSNTKAIGQAIREMTKPRETNFKSFFKS